MSTNRFLRRSLWLAAGAAVALWAADPAIPRKAADLAIQTGPEQYMWLSQSAGKTRVVAFILTGCSHCQFTTGILNRMQKDYAGRDVQMMASAIEPMSSLHLPEFRKLFMPAFPVGYNEQSYVAKFLGRGENDPMMVPQVVFVDRNGTIRAQFAGDDAAMRNEVQEKSLRDALDKTLVAK